MIVSLTLNCFLFYKLKTINDRIPEISLESKVPYPNESNEVPKLISKEKVFRIYVKPHPPNFTKGRYLEFIDFKVINTNQNSYVEFKEKNKAGVSSIKVDVEAIEWR